MIFEGIKKNFKRLLTYGIGNILQSAITFLLLPIYLKYFTPSEYGVINILLLVITFSSLFISSGLITSLQSQYFVEKDESRRKSLSGTVFIWHLTLSFVVGTIILCYSKTFSNLLFSTNEYSNIISLISLIIPLTLFVDIPFNIFIMEKMATKYVLLSIVRLILDIFLKYIFIITLQEGIKGYFISSVLSLLVVNIIVYLFAIKFISFKIHVDQLKILLRLGTPYIVTGFTIWSLKATDRFMLNFILNEAAVGIYSTGAIFSMIFSFLIHKPLSLLLPPIIFSYTAKHTDDENKILFRNLLNILFVFGGIFALLISVCSPDLIKILIKYFNCKPDYIRSISVIPFLTLSAFFYYLSFPASYISLMLKKSEILAIVSVFAAIINIIFNYILIHYYGILGASAATAFAFAFYTLVSSIYTAKYFKVNYNITSNLIVFITVCVLILTFNIIRINNCVISLIVKLLLSSTIYLCVMWFSCSYVTKDLKQKIIRYILNKFKLLNISKQKTT